MSIPWEALGLIPALFFALNGLFIRLGIDHSTPQTGNLIVVLVNLLGFTLALAWVDFTTIEYSVYWLVFLLAGLCSPALSLLFLFRSIKEIGVSATTPLSNIHAITGSFFAFILLGERPPAAVWAGILCVTIGVYILSGGDKLSGLAGRLRYIALPITAAVFFGLAHTIRKIGFAGLESIIFAGFLQALSAAVAVPLILRLTSGENIYRFEALSIKHFVIAGLCMIGAQFSLLYALSQGEVTRVSPVVSTTTFFTLILSGLFLGRRDPVTVRIIIGAILIVSGVVLVTLTG